ncbi:LysR family transcriptional regulator [Caballeronia sordidicola]|uniref:LysR family transcriptional regulator n=1 Tax=Caballeronia sordidicola TaxID=196367 RepID=A0A158HPI8_CABSO|nr:LysR substrate-binding domain-containing protein [Caballeronia sordidicola]SAL46308.1 LysR family transcriptional regulator [Caballeronia sordidicola]
MNQKQLEAFRLVIKTGSLTTASQQLHVSQPTMSRLLSELEKSIGLKLFDRRQGKISVRSEALAFYESVEKVFLGANYLRRVAEEIRNSVGVRLRVGCLPALGLTFMPEIIVGFYTMHPRTSIELTVATSSSVGESIAVGASDIAVVEGTPNLIGVDLLKSFSIPRVGVMRADDPLAQKQVLDLNSYSAGRIVWMASVANAQSTLVRDLGRCAPDSRGSLFVNLASTACRFVSLGAGIAVIDPITAMSLPLSGLVIKPLEPQMKFQFSILRSEKLVLSKEAKTFLDALVTRCEAIEKGLFASDTVVS